MCADAVLSLPTAYVTVPRGALLRVEGEAESVEGSLAKPKTRGDVPDLKYVHELDLSDATETLDARPGKYVLYLFTEWEQGDASFGFGIRILPSK